MTNSWVQKLAYFSSQETQNCCWNRILLGKNIREHRSLENTWGSHDLYFCILCIYDFCIYLFIFFQKNSHQSHFLRPYIKMWKPRRIGINKSHVYLNKLFEACLGGAVCKSPKGWAKKWPKYHQFWKLELFWFIVKKIDALNIPESHSSFSFSLP